MASLSYPSDGGDGWYDSASNLTDQLARWRNGFWWTQRDSATPASSDLADANLYLYVGGDPVNGWDPRGHLSLGGTLVAIGLGFVLAGLGLSYLGVAQHNQTLQTIGYWTFNGGIVAAGAGLGVATLGGPIWLRLAAGATPGVVKLIAGATLKRVATTAQATAQTLSISKGLFTVLSSVSGPVPLAGRIIQRPGQTNWWQLGYVNISGQYFTAGNITPMQGDLVYDYRITNVQTGHAFVLVRTWNNGAWQQVGPGIFEIQNGQLAGLPWMNPPGKWGLVAKHASSRILSHAFGRWSMFSIGFGFRGGCGLVFISSNTTVNRLSALH